MLVNIGTIRIHRNRASNYMLKSIYNGYKYCCDHCEYKGSKKDNLQYHVKSIHDGVKHYL